jgi:uncharacterized membrane protein YphA (DoxX/SURF4 family)
MKPVRSAARALLGTIFVVSGARTLTNPTALVEPAKRVTDPMTPLISKVHPRLPTDPRTLVRFHAAVDLLGGLLLATGHLTRPAAAALAANLVPTTIAGHPFWSFPKEERRAQQIHFLKNLGLIGGLLLAASDTEGRPGLRYRTEHAVQRGQRSMRRTVRTARREAKIAAVSATAARRLPG